MNKHQAIALFVVLATGCSAPRSSVVKTAGIEEVTKKQFTPYRVQPVEQLQVDAATVYGQMIEYYSNEKQTDDTPEAPSVQQAVSHRLEAVLSFPPGSIKLIPSYGGNRAELAHVIGKLKSLSPDTGGQWQSVRITGYASPDGSTVQNEELATGRALRFSSFLSRELAMPQQKITVGPCQEDWNGLRQLVAESKKPYAAQVLEVLDNTANPDERRSALKAIKNGSVWKDMEQTLFSKLRRMELEVVLLSNEPVAAVHNEAKETDLGRLLALFNSHPEDLTLDELLTIAPVYRPGTEQYREVYEQAAYRFPDCREAQLNAGAAALAASDTLAARFFLDRVENNPASFLNQGVLCLQEGDVAAADGWFRKALPFRPRQARSCLELVKQMRQEPSAGDANR